MGRRWTRAPRGPALPLVAGGIATIANGSAAGAVVSTGRARRAGRRVRVDVLGVVIETEVREAASLAGGAGRLAPFAIKRIRRVDSPKKPVEGLQPTHPFVRNS